MTGRIGIGTALEATRVVAILRAARGDRLEAVCEALLGAGVRCLEITTNTPSGLDAVRKLAAAGTDAEVGVGTVRTVEQVDRAAEAGASFVVAPGTNAAVGRRAGELGLAWYPGALSPTEIEHAWSLGAAAVKVFPAASAGGPGYLREVRAPLDDIPLVPTGGVRIDDVAAYLDAGAFAVGLGGQLIGDALVSDDADLAALRQRAERALAAAGTAGR
ncbi:bifunctional 4-hydroxy-2-oxoglutarate aldolase/2-dehydro-3-deoxy-phosphogluconate aldolase [Pseudonocardia acaciae]|uniref:bifunctional 4-hydroxy-2-oxoglutarate aldolase/2-dehydro-3-deoxy-phosphogluconate aldolase n=1 Tax=Pseudonocardia acaciae TaxID=551276 RepID=UPI0005671BBF|nr:bifunctional 4-hydroxy-2-oxoglutarate aldolase/2-dehydro-3-deoxy-phosphogluconate aldolase [Pseudonocardia acaciae]